MIAGLMVCIVSFPVVARARAEGDAEAARDRVERDLGFAALVVLAGTVVLVACAPQLVQLLFERGQFTAADTAATASVMRVYSLGLLGQAMVGTLIRPFLAVRPVVSFGVGKRRLERSDWYPLAAMGLGLVVTAGVGTATAPRFGAVGLAAANAAGITLTAVLLLQALRARGVRVRLGTVLGGQARLLVAALAGTGAALAGAALPAPAALSLLSGSAAGLAAFTATALLLRAPELAVPLAVVRRRLRPAASA
jgi:putative peptidoglycan lipid II flippase